MDPRSKSRLIFASGVLLAVVLVGGLAVYIYRPGGPGTLTSTDSLESVLDEPVIADPLVQGAGLSLSEAIGTRKLLYGVIRENGDNSLFMENGSAKDTTEFGLNGEIAGAALVSPDGKRLAYVSTLSSESDAEASLRVLTFATKEDREVKRMTEWFGLLAWMPDGESLLVSEAQVEQTVDGEIENTNLLGTVLRTMNVGTGEERVVLDASMLPEISPFVIGSGTVAVSPDGRTLYAVIGNDADGPPVGTLYRVDLGTKKAASLLDLTTGPYWTSIVPDPWYPDRSKVIVAGEEGVSAFDVKTKKLQPFPTGDGDAPYSPISPDGKSMLVVRDRSEPDQESGTVPIDVFYIKLDTGEEVKVASNDRARWGGFTPPTIWSPDSAFLLFGFDGQTYRFDVGTKEIRSVFDDDLNGENFVQFYGWVS